MRRIALVLALLSVPALASADVDVRYAAGRMDVHARVAPVSEVLDRISRQAGVKLLYDGAPPRTLISASMDHVTVQGAIMGVMQGLNLDYAIAFDRTGRQVATLMIMGTGGGGASPATPVSRAAPAPYVPVPDATDEDVAPPDDDSAADDAAANGDEPPSEDQPSTDLEGPQPEKPPPGDEQRKPEESRPAVWPGAPGWTPPPVQPAPGTAGTPNAPAPLPFTVVNPPVQQ